MDQGFASFPRGFLLKPQQSSVLLGGSRTIPEFQDIGIPAGRIFYPQFSDIVE
jgi:hypothetical protein